MRTMPPLEKPSDALLEGFEEEFLFVTPPMTVVPPCGGGSGDIHTSDSLSELVSQEGDVGNCSKPGIGPPTYLSCKGANNLIGYRRVVKVYC